ncbi:hypothetical protein N7495_008654 [Penicillium taxi]|uniref:uncharacterized protein n=1 Tax=Penicillium taxi TaxID=168475 RepID=UPI0025455A5E|nr:uncharacterized protein N7495_008654 [Penicillium taxi]KAJ5888613.1 hypothetical protein N7495_008654 [Penicillium taxi]
MSVSIQRDSVGDETIFSTIKYIGTEIREAQRLRDLKLSLLSVEDLSWIDGVITEAEKAAHTLAQLLEPYRIERESRAGRLNMTTRLRWALGDGQRARDQYAHMTICHQSLTTTIAFLQNRNALIPVATSRIEPTHQLGLSTAQSQTLPPSYALSQVLTWRRSWKASSTQHQIRKKTPVELE